MTHHDLIVIGSGPAGRAAAIQAGKLKRKVLVIDRKNRLGGVSVHTGTIPSKTLRETVLNLKGTVDYFVGNTFNYPTLAEAYKIAGLDAFNRMPIPEEYKVRRKPAGKP